jgi:hypothetical protein
MRIIESRSIDNQAGLLGSRLITGTNVIEGAFQSFIVAEDTVVTKVYNSIGIDVTGRLGLTSITLKAGAFISMPKNDYFSSIKLTSGSVVAYFVSHGGMTITAQAYLNEFLARVGSSYLEASECVKAHLQQLINIGLLQKASLIMSPSMYEEDLVKSVVPQDGSGDLSFTRASNGTRINSAGLVEVCPWNLLEQSETFNTTWGANNLTVTANTTTAPNGTTTADTFTLTASVDSSVYQAVNGESNNYTISVYAKYVSGDKYLYFFSPLNSQGEKVWFDIQNGTVSNQLSGFTGTIEDAGNGWYKCSMYNTTAAVLDYLQMGISTTNSSRTLSNNSVSYFWGAQVNTGALKPYFPTTDRLNVPRLTYQNGGGGCPSLLLEKQSTNLLKWSNGFTQFDWTTYNGTTTDNETISPDGTQNASKIIMGGGDSATLRQPIGGLTNGSTYTFSLYIKQGSGVTAFLDISDTASTVNITPTSEWVRYTYTANWNTSLNFVDIELRGTSGSAYCYIWGAQLEAGSYPTSYIPTTSSSATRVADFTSRSGLALTNFTFAVNFKPLDYVVELFDFEKTGGGRMFYVAVQSGGFITFNGVSGGTIGGVGSVLPKNQTCKLAFSLNASTSDLKIYINGSIIGTYATNITTFGAFFGLQSFGYNPGTQIEQIAIFPSVLTDAECQSLTTL